MERPAPLRPPGWYCDPDDPARLRYWGGRAWTNRRRLRPSWTIATAELVLPEAGAAGDSAPDAPVLDGPVRPAALPAVASALTGPPAGRPFGRSTGPGGPRRHPLNSLDFPGRPHLPPGGSLRAAREASRRPLVALVAAVAVALLVMSVTVGVSHRYSAALPSVADSRFVSAANSACASSMGALRSSPPAGAPGQASSGAGSSGAGSSGSGGLLSASRASRSADVVSRLRDQLLALPSESTTGPGVKAWLASWARFANDRRAYAKLVAATSAASRPVSASVTARRAQLAEDALGAATAADKYALAHGLTECALTAHPLASPVVSVP